MADITDEEASARARRFQDGGMSVTARMVRENPHYFSEDWANRRQEDHDRWTAMGTAYDRRQEQLMKILKA